MARGSPPLWLSPRSSDDVLTSCATGNSNNETVTSPRCPPLIDYPEDTQKQAAEELKKLPPGAALPNIVADYSPNYETHAGTSNGGPLR